MSNVEISSSAVHSVLKPIFKTYVKSFSVSVLLVFLGTSVSNSFNLFSQIIAAHNLPSVDFASVNALLSLFMLVAIPAGTLQTAVAARVSANRLASAGVSRGLMRFYLSLGLLAGVISSAVVCLSAGSIKVSLGLFSLWPVYILAAMLFFSWLLPVMMGFLQGKELFGWFTAANSCAGVLKLGLVSIFTVCGSGVNGTMLAFCIAVAVCLIVASVPGIRLFDNSADSVEYIPVKSESVCLFSVAGGLFLFTLLSAADMILVKHFFTPGEAGIYALAQMAGKIFLFLPSAVPLVMLPRASGLFAAKQDSVRVLRKSILYTCLISASAAGFFNLFPVFSLRLLSGTVYADSVLLSRLFSLSMSVYAVVYVLIVYFISRADFRFLKLLAFSALLQTCGIIFFHGSLIVVQQIMCVNSLLLLAALFPLLVKSKLSSPPQQAMPERA